MSKRFCPVVVALAICAVGVFCSLAGPQLAAQDKQPPAKDAAQQPVKGFFGLTKVWQFHIELPAKEWETMQLVSGGKFFGFGPPKKEPDKPAVKPTDVHKNNAFGMEFPWARAEFTAGGKTYKNVGLRY